MSVIAMPQPVDTPLTIVLTPLQAECLEEALIDYLVDGDDTADWFLEMEALLNHVKKRGRPE